MMTDNNSPVQYDVKDKINYILGYYQEISDKINNKYDGNIRFCDFFNLNESALVNINYFQSFCNDSETLMQYAKYMVDRWLEDLLFAMGEEEIGFEELLELLDCDNLFDDVIYALKYADELIKNRDSLFDEMEFLKEDNEYKIMFTDRARDDIMALPKNILYTFIRKLYHPLSTDTVIKLSENIDHTNESYGTNYKRIQFSDDYRIAYFRTNDITIILGVSLKTGKPIDYTRYDAMAKKNKLLLAQAEDFSNEIYTKEHVETLDYIKNQIDKKKQR